MADRDAAVQALNEAISASWVPLPGDPDLVELAAERILDVLSPDDAGAIARALPGSLDHAWAEAEAALPDGWHIGIEYLRMGGAVAWTQFALVKATRVNGTGTTPAAALLALAEKLREARG